MSVYEVHLGSWRRIPEDHNRSLNYRELAHQLGDYVTEMGFTHVELMPVMEHPFYGSWGYQVTGYLRADLALRHAAGLHVLGRPSAPARHRRDSRLGAVALSERRARPRLLRRHASLRARRSAPGVPPEWNSSIFNYGRAEVRNFLGSSALFWLDQYHIDGLRVDAVASMLYLDYARKAGEWIPNKYGGHENLDAVEFLKNLNLAVYREHRDTQTIAEESTAWPSVSRPTYLGGLGFGLKWNMGWMHDTLKYFQANPIFRKYQHNKLTFSLIYAFTENFVLPLSHDEVVHGKGSLLGKMSGDEWQQFANLRLLYGYMWGHAGKKLLFMGGEFGQTARVDARGRPRVVGAAVPAPSRHQALGAGHQPLLPRDARALSAGLQRRRASSGSTATTRTPARCRSSARARHRRDGARRLQLHAGASRQLPRRRASRRHVARAPEQRCAGLRRRRACGNFGQVEAVPLPCHGRHHSPTLRPLPPLPPTAVPDAGLDAGSRRTEQRPSRVVIENHRPGRWTAADFPSSAWPASSVIVEAHVFTDGPRRCWRA